MKTTSEEIINWHSKKNLLKLRSSSLQSIEIEKESNTKKKYSVFFPPTQKQNKQKSLTIPSISQRNLLIDSNYHFFSLPSHDKLGNSQILSPKSDKIKKKSSSKYDRFTIWHNLRKISNIFQILFNPKKKKKICFSIKFFLSEIFFPNSVAGMIVLFLLYMNRNGYAESCEVKDSYHLIYICFVSTPQILYFFLFGYYMFFPFLFDGIPKNMKVKLKVFPLIIVCMISFVMKALKLNGLYLLESIDFDIHTINFLFGFLYVYFLFRKYAIALSNLIRITKIFAMFFSTIVLHYYLIRNYFYVYLHSIVILNEYGKYVFQIMLLIYLKVYGQIIFNLTVQFFKIIPHSKKKSHEAFDSVLLFLKYYISDAIHSCIIMPVVSHSDNFELLFGLFNFSFQLSILYSTKNRLSFYANRFWFWIRGKPIEKKKSDSINRKCKLIIAGSTNDMIIIIMVRMLIMFNFPQFIYSLNSSRETDLVLDCKYIINSKIYFHQENLAFLILIVAMNFVYSISFFYDRENSNGNKKSIWKLESYNCLLKICYNTLIHLINDFHLQFYFNLYWVASKNVKSSY